MIDRYLQQKKASTMLLHVLAHVYAQCLYWFYDSRRTVAPCLFDATAHASTCVLLNACVSSQDYRSTVAPCLKNKVT